MDDKKTIFSEDLFKALNADFDNVAERHLKCENEFSLPYPQFNNDSTLCSTEAINCRPHKALFP